MPLNPQIQAQLDAGKDAPPPYLMSVPQVRSWLDDILILDESERAPVHRVEDRMIPIPDGQLPIRIYWSSDKPNLPVLYFVHGGGFVVGNINTHDNVCRILTNYAECITVAVDYRLAPEHKFPTPLYDTYLTAHWVAHNAAALGGDPARIAIGGDSAGGNLAAATTLLARDHGAALFMYQLLFYPVTDYFLPGTPSYSAYAQGYGLDRDFMIWFWNHYVAHDQSLDNPYLCPLRAQNLGGLPPAYVMTSTYDVLHDEGEQYAQRLRQAGVRVTHENFDDTNHGFLDKQVDVAADALQHIGEHLQRVFYS